jgi:hypothetical protein
MNGFKIILGVIGVMCATFGAISAGQGLGLFRGTPMTGSPQAIYAGLAMLVIGAALALWPARTGLARDLAGAVSVPFALFGSVWALQGVGVLPGSFMSNDITWTFIGGVWIVIAVALFIWATRRRSAA